MTAPSETQRALPIRATQAARRIMLAAMLVTAACGDSAVSPPTPSRLAFASGSALIGLRGQATLTPLVLDARDDPIASAGGIVWTSSDESIASVDDAGVVRGVALGGPVEITARLGELTASVTARVTPAQVLITPEVESLEVGTSVVLSAQVLDALGDPIPAVEIAWSTGTSDVVSLDQSTLVLSAVGSGGALVSASAAGQTGFLSLVVGVRTELDGTFASDLAASTYVEVEVLFGRVVRLSGSLRYNGTCSLNVSVRPNVDLTDDNRFDFELPAGPSTWARGVFSTANTLNGSIALPLAGTACATSGGGVFATNYSATRR